MPIARFGLIRLRVVQLSGRATRILEGIWNLPQGLHRAEPSRFPTWLPERFMKALVEACAYKWLKAQSRAGQ